MENVTIRAHKQEAVSDWLNPHSLGTMSAFGCIENLAGYCLNFSFKDNTFVPFLCCNLMVCICLSVEVTKLQVIILARSSREMSQTVRID